MNTLHPDTSIAYTPGHGREDDTESHMTQIDASCDGSCRSVANLEASKQSKVHGNHRGRNLGLRGRHTIGMPWGCLPRHLAESLTWRLLSRYTWGLDWTGWPGDTSAWHAGHWEKIAF